MVSQDSDVFFSSRVEKSSRNDMDIVSLKDKTTMLSQNIWHHSVTDFHISEEQKAQLHQCNSVKSHYALCSLFYKWPFQIHAFLISFPYFSFPLPVSCHPHLSIFLLFCLLTPHMQLFHLIINFICPFHWISPFTVPSLLSWSPPSDIAPLQSVFHMHPYFYPTSLAQLQPCPGPPFPNSCTIFHVQLIHLPGRWGHQDSLEHILKP